VSWCQSMMPQLASPSRQQPPSQGLLRSRKRRKKRKKIKLSLVHRGRCLILRTQSHYIGGMLIGKLLLHGQIW
jgi:hypothetical protein